ncbi:MAG: SGNH/GDSL hydrolase family protein [Balneolaceae bacterium]|nr:SGNH/GDSL hydrolase family protein [Balneolaceae bacterium]MBO6546475.1 SGNH/GDSL hydrolase family protein [Balneolaceae bacterium]MBO6648834.1 SGNH/GDSL hydrolase family protein [Balneolaceae bacterium]
MSKDGLIILLISLGVLAGIEVAMQFAYYFGMKKNPGQYEQPELAFQFNEDYLVELVPTIKKTYIRSEENGGDSIHWKVNRDGFRGSELKNDSEVKVMVYGDSNIQARFSVEESTYVYKLGKFLKESTGKGIEVINAGVVGFGPDQAMLKFEREVDIYKPDVVILNIFAGNDFGDIIRNRLFELNEKNGLVKTPFKTEPDQEFKKEEGFKFRLLEWTKSVREGMDERRNEKRAVEAPEAYERGVFDYFDKANQEAYEIYKKGEQRYFSNFQDSYETDIATAPESEASQEKKLLMKSVIARMNELAIEKEVQFAVQILPSSTDLTPSNYVLGNEFLKKNYPDYNQGRLTNILSEFTRELEIPSINLYQMFLQNNPETLFFRGENNHWNDFGQDLAAKVAASFIADSVLN